MKRYSILAIILQRGACWTAGSRATRQADRQLAPRCKRGRDTLECLPPKQRGWVRLNVNDEGQPWVELTPRWQEAWVTEAPDSKE